MKRAKLPRDVQQRCIWLVRGYERCRRDYKELRQSIIDGGGGNYSTYKVKVSQDKDGKPFLKSAERSRPVGILQAARPKIKRCVWIIWSACLGCEICGLLNMHGPESEQASRKQCEMHLAKQ